MGNKAKICKVCNAFKFRNTAVDERFCVCCGCTNPNGCCDHPVGKSKCRNPIFGVEQLIALLAGQPISCTTLKLFVMAAAFNPKAEVQVAVEVKATAAVEVETQAAWSSAGAGVCSHR